AFFAILLAVMTRILIQTEEYHLEEQMEMVTGVVADSTEYVVAMSLDNAFWQETVDFAKGENPHYIERNWPSNNQSVLESYKLNIYMVLDRDGNVVMEEYRDFITGEPIVFAGSLAEYLAPARRDALENYDPAHEYEEHGRHGVAIFQDMPMYLCVTPVVVPESGEEPAGVLVVGVVLSDGYFDALTHLHDTDYAVFYDEAALEERPVPTYTDRDTLQMTLGMKGLTGERAALRITMPRTLYSQGIQGLSMAMILLVAAVAVYVAVAYMVIVRRMIAPVEHISDDIARLEPSARLDVGPYAHVNEFATLGDAVNDMLGRQDQSNISLSVFQSILNGMDANLCVTDPITDEILFMNEKMIRDFGFEAIPVGEVCWKVLQTGLEGRCDFCPIEKLLNREALTLSWEEHNPVTGKYYRNEGRLIEWADRRLVHLKHSVDITESKQAGRKLEKRLQQQELMAALSRNFISTRTPGELIDDALRMTGEFLGVDRVLIGLADREKNALLFIHEWYDSAEVSEPLLDKTSPFGPGDDLYEAIVARGEAYVSCDDVTQSGTYHYLQGVGVASFIDIPILRQDALWGVLCIDECSTPHVWTTSDIHFVSMIGNIISAAVTRGEMEESLFRMSSIVDSSPQYISYVSEDGGFTYVNKGAQAHSGYTREELLTGGMYMLFDEETRRRIEAEIIPQVQDKGRLAFEMPMIRKDGEIRTMSFSAFTTDHEEYGIAAIATDVTEMHRLQRELLDAKEQAEQSNRAKSDFLSRMSHEMRTPMNAIIGMTSIAKASGDKERMAYCLDKIDNASNHLLGVINDILDMSKIEADKFELSYTDFEFEKMLMRVTNVINFRVEEKRQDFIIDVADDVPRAIVSDEQRLAQV
ncbi:PAS domain S-box protein, partial [Ruminococcaceae bacterium OttesenSCG-928-L11]|nr:PAS domain S-box protein [Ruminococcaceae bacterium OttesenSCG-928-L11]